ncbi:Autophagy-related protein 9A [Pseudolycoriella hygida]|uniref:Autophagy-related protein 9 n=1 Tax=Pseudolycoriella hygida TaxID=35572 RepID=A0A9Q0MP18_9DIPT|nr:Autophagy-related protein 9A [Pseudolycoriella hygida]
MLKTMASPDVKYSSVTNDGNPFKGQHLVTIEDDILPTDSDNDDAPQNSGIMIHVVPDTSKSRWNHIEDLDSFFTRMYNYHQRHGFHVMMLQEILELVQFCFVVFFVTYIIHGINYPVLFREGEPLKIKITLEDVMYPIGHCISSITAASWIILFLAMLFWQFRTIKVIYHAIQYYDIKKFYNTALKIEDSELDNLTWHEVQQKILEVQAEQQMCIHKDQLTELDIYHRILRFKNYMVALMNKNLLPSTICPPFIGESVCFSRGLRYNIEMILFRGPWAPFQNNWHLKEEYKRASNRNELAQKMSRQIFWVAFGNFLLSPLVLLWSMMVFFFSYADLIKREPGTLGTRCWSQYGMLYMRHFNELDHELHARLNRAYRPAVKYMTSFSSPMMAVIARNVLFMGGGSLTVLVLLAIYDEDVVQVAHVLTLMSILGAMVVIARVFIPDENLIWCPEQLMTAVLAHTHYLPMSWRGLSHTSRVRDQFGHFFQLRAMYLLNELLSPITTPYILMFYLRPRSLDIIDFFRNFTVSVVGVGDVCAFAQMDVRKHGNPAWQPTNSADPEVGEVLTPLPTGNQFAQGEQGKTELSLVHFTLTNPGWKMPTEAKQFVHSIKRHAMNDIDRTRVGANTAMEQSLFSVGSMGGECPSYVQSFLQGRKLHDLNQTGLSSLQSHYYGSSDLRNPFSPTMNLRPDPSETSYRQSYHLANIQEDETEPPNAYPSLGVGASMGMSMVGGMSRREGPPYGSQDGLLYSICGGASVMDNVLANEFTATDMCLNTLYLHELYHRRTRRRLEQIQSPWQQARHTDSTMTTDDVGFSQPSTSASGAAERTPLLAPKKS